MNNDKTFFSYGGGVQSTAIALMLIHNPEIFTEKGLKLPQHILFSDTGAEPDYVLETVETIFKMLTERGFSTYTVRAKNSILEDRGITTPPYFTENDNGEQGILRRQCTQEYKIAPLQKKQRELLGYKPKQRIPEETATLWMGISVDEAQRAKLSRAKWIKNEYPLIALGLNRSACAVYNYKHLGYEVKKSSCFFCPFKHKEEWVNMKRDDPKNFAKAVAFDEKIRTLNNDPNTKIKDKCFIHRSGYPLKDAVGQGIQLSIFSHLKNQTEQECLGGCFL